MIWTEQQANQMRYNQPDKTDHPDKSNGNPDHQRGEHDHSQAQAGDIDS